jgi:hypothetical protein
LHTDVLVAWWFAMLDFDELAPDKSKEKNLKRSPSISLRAKGAFPLLQISASVGKFRARNDSIYREFVSKEVQARTRGDAMARSVEELRRESEGSRAELAATVDRLRERITDTADDIRHKASPQHIKSEVSDYVGQKTRSWIGALKERALENPLQALAAGAVVAVPLVRLARGVPLPLLMIGAGLALTSKTVRNRVEETAGPAKEKAEDLLGRAREFQGQVEEAASSTRSQVGGMADDAQNAAAQAGAGFKDRAAQAFGSVADKASSGVDMAKDAMERLGGAARGGADAAKEAALQAPVRAGEVIGDNAALIGGLGVAIGAIFAAALPSTEAEAKAMGRSSDRVKQAAGEAAASGFEAVKEAAILATDAAAKSMADADLGKHASRMTEGVAEKLKEAADDAVAVAFDPSRNTNT